MIELRIRNGPLGGHERIFRVNLKPDDLAEFIAFLDEIPDRDGHNVHLLEYNGREKQIRQGDISEIHRAIADPCYLERRKVLRAKKLILDLLEQRGAMRIEDLSNELKLAQNIIVQAVGELKEYLEFGDGDTVRHKYAEAEANHLEVFSGHVSGPGGSSRRELAEGSDGPGSDGKKREV